MKIITAAVLTLLLAACSRSPEQQLASRWGTFKQYCTDCHNDAEAAGELSLEHRSPADVAAHPEIFEHVVRKLRGSLMPPPGEPRPPTEQVHGLVAALESDLDAAARAKGATPGRVLVHRLNRTEYQTAVHELLGVDLDAAKLLPADTTSDGFDNVAEVLRVTPTYLDQYIAAAREVSIEAVGNPSPPPERSDYRSTLENHTAHVDGLPLGTRGGMLVPHDFPADGEYAFSLDVSSEPGAELRAYPQGWLEYRHRVILTVDGTRVFDGELGGEQELRAVDQEQISAVNAIRRRFHEIRVPVKAGHHEIGATFVARSHGESDYELESFVPGEGIPDVPRVLGVEIVGPYGPSGIGESTESRKRIFICRPETAEEESPCAQKILTHLARLAWRRPVDDGDLAKLLAFYKTGRAAGGFETGIQKGLLAILASTNFLYRVEADVPDGVKPGEAYPITDVELASRLAFFLWSAGPDDGLLGLAEAGKLHEPAVYEREIARMFADPKSRALVDNFAFQWLGLRNAETVEPDPKLYPNFDADLRKAFDEEMALYLDSILRDDKLSVVDLLTARYTFVNERLARHYGIDGVRGDRFRRVELTDPNRWGLFGKGDVLLATAYPDRTSPVLRGAWIMEHLLGTPPESPPPTVNTNLAPASIERPKSVRERLALHRTVSSCNHCHGVIDPLGQALENYNAVGEWRTFERDTGVAIDATGRLASGEQVAGPVDLRNALTANPEQYVQAVVQSLMTYALGRRVEYYDMPTVRAIVRDAARSHNSFASIVAGVANSTPFKMRSVQKTGPTDTVASTQERAAERD